MKYLLDVNVLIAWGWQDHPDHARVDNWIAGVLKIKSNKVLTSAIPELGFVRVSVQRGSGKVTAARAGVVLEGMAKSLAKAHEFLPDDQDARTWPTWCQGAARTTDAHLLRLAQAHGAELATLDTGIPGAFVIP